MRAPTLLWRAKWPRSARAPELPRLLSRRARPRPRPRRCTLPQQEHPGRRGRHPRRQCRATSPRLRATASPRRCATASRSTPSGWRRSPPGSKTIAALPDPVGRTLARWTRPNGLDIERVAVPLGVIGIIYESRPNVTADAGGLALKSGNAAILRGGSESFYSSRALVAALAEGLHAAGLPEAAIQLVPTRDRAAVGLMLGMSEYIDVIVPRGGRSLIERVQRESRIPVIAHLEGLCHTYVDGAADPAKARAIVLNAKMRRVSICGATETLLVDRKVAAAHAAGDPRRSARSRLRIARRRRGRGDRPCPVCRPTRRIGAPNISTRSCRSRSSTASTGRSRISTAGARTTPTRSSPRTRRRRSAFCARSTARSCWSTPRPNSPMAASSAWARRSASRPNGCRRADRSAPSELTTYKYLVRGNGQVRP